MFSQICLCGCVQHLQTQTTAVARHGNATYKFRTRPTWVTHFYTLTRQPLPFCDENSRIPCWNPLSILHDALLLYPNAQESALRKKLYILRRTITVKPRAQQTRGHGMKLWSVTDGSAVNNEVRHIVLGETARGSEQRGRTSNAFVSTASQATIADTDIFTAHTAIR